MLQKGRRCPLCPNTSLGCGKSNMLVKPLVYRLEIKFYVCWYVWLKFTSLCLGNVMIDCKLHRYGTLLYRWQLQCHIWIIDLSNVNRVECSVMVKGHHCVLVEVVGTVLRGLIDKVGMLLQFCFVCYQIESSHSGINAFYIPLLDIDYWNLFENIWKC